MENVLNSFNTLENNIKDDNINKVFEDKIVDEINTIKT